MGWVGDSGRAVAGPAVRRLRREWQWSSAGRATLRLDRAPEDAFTHLAAEHATPLYRRLAGVDQQLQRNKVVNLRLAGERIDGLVLEPGQRFSFWWHVGRATARRGFRPGLVLSHGRTVAGVGGGLCQMTNLIYWMTLHTPLTVVERWRHSYDVFPDVDRRQPFGSGATCAWPVLDLQIENRTPARFRLGVALTGTHLTGQWRAEVPATTRFEVYEAEHVMTNDAPGVFTRRNVLRRKSFDLAGTEVADELVAVNHARMMYQPFLGSGPA